MKPRNALILSLFPLLSACGGTQEDYQAVYQVVPDAHILYIGNHYLLARDNDGAMYLVQSDGFGEASYVKRLY